MRNREPKEKSNWTAKLFAVRLPDKADTTCIRNRTAGSDCVFNMGRFYQSNVSVILK